MKTEFLYNIMKIENKVDIGIKIKLTFNTKNLQKFNERTKNVYLQVIISYIYKNT